MQSMVVQSSSPSTSLVCRRIGEIFALGGNAVCQMLGVVPDTPNEARSPSRLPWQSKEVDPGLDRDAALMLRPALVVESVNIQPAIVSGKSRCPDDRRDPCLRQVQLADRI